MDVIPAIDVEAGRSRVVYWPGASAGIGAPTDRPDRIAEQFVAQGARILHLVDFDGAQRAAPANLEAVGAVAARVAVPLQVAGGLEEADHVRLAFAAGATRVVALDRDRRAARGARRRASRSRATGSPSASTRGRTGSRRSRGGGRRGAHPRRARRGARGAAASHRLVLSHGGTSPTPTLLDSLVRRHDADILVAGGATDLDGVRRLRDAGVAGVILGEALLSGAIDFPRALEAAA